MKAITKEDLKLGFEFNYHKKSGDWVKATVISISSSHGYLVKDDQGGFGYLFAHEVIDTEKGQTS